MLKRLEHDLLELRDPDTGATAITASTGHPSGTSRRVRRT